MFLCLYVDNMMCFDGLCLCFFRKIIFLEENANVSYSLNVRTAFWNKI